MAGLFDFEHYYTEKRIKTDIKLDVSDIPMKSTATSSTMNEDGTVDEVNMNEIVTNNVMYRINGITLSDGSFANTTDRIAVTTATKTENAIVYNKYYLGIGYSLDDLIEAGLYVMPESRSLITSIEISVGYSLGDVTVTEISCFTDTQSTTDEKRLASFTLYVIPRYHLMTPTAQLNVTGFDSVNQNFWHQDGQKTNPAQNTARALAGTGLLGSMYKGMKWYDKQSQGKLSAVYYYDSFMKMLNSLGNTAKANNLGIKTVFYDTSFADTTDWTQTGIKTSAKMKEVYGSAVSKFLKKCESKNPNPVLDISNDGATAIIPNVSDVFKKLYTDKEELASEFTNHFFDTYNALMSIQGVRKFMSNSLKAKLDDARYKLKKRGTDSPQFLLDLASFRNRLDYYAQKGIIAPITDDNYEHSVRMIQDWDARIKYNSKYNPSDNTYSITVLSDGSAKSSTSSYSTYGKTRYIDWQIMSNPMTVADIKVMLCDYFTGMFNAKYGKSEGDDGYVKWYYDTDTSQENQRYKFTVTCGGKSYVLYARNVAIDEPNTGIVTPDNIIAHVNAHINAQQPIEYYYYGTARQFVDQSIAELSALIDTRDIIPTVTVNIPGYVLDDDKSILVAEWEEASTASDVMAFSNFRPAYATLDDLGDENATYTINDCVNFVENVMGEALDEIDTILSVQGFLLGPTFLLVQKLRLRGANAEYAELQDVIDRIKWYQLYTNESVFDNKTFIGVRPNYTYDDTPFVFMPARFLVPVLMYKRVRVKYKRFFRTRHKMVKRSIGVRWCEVTFVDNDVYEAYPPNSEEPRQYYPIGKTAHVSMTADSTVFTFDSDIEGDTVGLIDVGKVTKFSSGSLLLVNADGLEVSVEINSASKFTAPEIINGIGTSVYVVGIYVPLETTAKSDERTKVRIEYKMPYIPYDAELRRWAFMNYGAFDQDIYASESREVPADPDEKVPGWVIFKNSSKRIGDMRASMGIYDAVSILLGILRNTFGASCVELAETMRSVDDQELMCSGGGESTFLSWHNYGLAAKILINDPTTGLPIEDGSPEFKTLIDVADAFTDACYNGAFGKPLNVVWCGRLKLGANNFVWEFLPIGVGHKDAVKFREALLNQEDPVVSLGYVDVDAKGYVYKSRPTEVVPYILSGSAAYKNSIVINGHHYVSPKNIRNYTTPHDLVLENIIEFGNLIKTKMQANGSSLNGRASMYEWKALNDRSYKQLLMYYGLTGSITAARALVCGEYVETYKDTVERKYSENMVDMVKDFLGNLYDDVKIYIEDAADGGAWLTLKDGKLHMKTTDIRPIFDQKSKDNFYGEKMAPVECTERGLYLDGVFRTEDELEQMGYEIEKVSDNSFIDGFKNGEVVGDDALLLHSLVATQIKEEFDKLRETFENYGGAIMYDHFADGPNASMEDMVENEFGLIAGQDLIGFDELRAIFAQKDINDTAGQYSDGTLKGVSGDDVFEKVVSNAELSGVRKASLTREHINVTAPQNTMTTEQLYRAIMKGTMTQANDMFSK